MEGLLAAFEASGFAAEMRRSVFLYPVANVVHILAALVFFAAVAAMDFRVFKATTVANARAFIERVRPVAIAAFLFQVASGVMLLAPEATHIWHNPVFRLKLVAIAVGLLNVALLEVLIRRQRRETVGAGVRGAAGLSLAVWLSVAALGRLIAYF
jgi:hypothetical protein